MFVLYGKRIRKLRLSLRLTPDQLGGFVGVSGPTINGYECETRKPNLNILKKLADYFNVSTDYLIGRIDDPSPYSSWARIEEQAEYRIYDTSGVQVIARIAIPLNPDLFHRLQVLARQAEVILDVNKEYY